MSDFFIQIFETLIIALLANFLTPLAQRTLSSWSTAYRDSLVKHKALRREIYIEAASEGKLIYLVVRLSVRLICRGLFIALSVIIGGVFSLMLYDTNHDDMVASAAWLHEHTLYFLAATAVELIGLFFAFRRNIYLPLVLYREVIAFALEGISARTLP
jgi:hypothetical protein